MMEPLPDMEPALGMQAPRRFPSGEPAKSMLSFVRMSNNLVSLRDYLIKKGVR